jgi:hypothetical protein
MKAAKPEMARVIFYLLATIIWSFQTAVLHRACSKTLHLHQSLEQITI